MNASLKNNTVRPLKLLQVRGKWTKQAIDFDKTLCQSSWAANSKLFAQLIYCKFQGLLPVNLVLSFAKSSASGLNGCLGMVVGNNYMDKGWGEKMKYW